MKLNHLGALAVLCGFLFAGASIMQNYLTARATVRGGAHTSEPSPDPSEMRARFLTDQYWEASEEECAYMALYEYAQSKKNDPEMMLLREAHRRHCEKPAKSLIAKKKPARRRKLPPENSNHTIDVTETRMSLDRMRPSLLPYIDEIFHVRQQKIL